MSESIHILIAEDLHQAFQLEKHENMVDASDTKKEKV
jgi:hypothetical protein